MDFSKGDYIEAKINLSELSRAKQNILSIGEDVKNWSPSGNIEKFNIHFYFPNDINDKRLRFSIVCNTKVNNTNRRTMGIINSDIFYYNDETSYIITLKFDKYGFYVNDHLITRDDFTSVEVGKTPEWPKNPSGIGTDVWTYPDYLLPHFENLVSLQFGSMEGTTRTWAYYEYIKYHKNL